MLNYEKIFNEKKTTAEELAAKIQSGMKIMSDIACGQPIDFYSALSKRMITGEIKNVEINSLLDSIPFSWYIDEEACRRNKGVSWFSGANLRKLINNGLADINPGTYWDFPNIIRKEKEFDYCIIVVSSMDRHGYFSVGLTSSLTPAMIEKSHHVLLEVNENMPYTVADPHIHISDVDALCVSSSPIPELATAPTDEISERIGQYIADEVVNGSTLQLGIGAIPNAVGSALRNKKHLGIHTEMFTDSMVDLIECGAVDNSLKPINVGKSITTFAMGSRKMYDFMDNNPSIQLMPVDYVNDPNIIGSHPNFVSVNAALEVDFYGQVCAESIGTRHFSGSGGQIDYVRGCRISNGGKSFIAFPSTAKGGTVSKISPTLTAGALVTTTKNDVDMIVTEYGIARLHGKTLSERTRALIKIAHPSFRDKLLFEAKKMNILI